MVMFADQETVWVRQCGHVTRLLDSKQVLESKVGKPRTSVLTSVSRKGCDASSLLSSMRVVV